MTPRFETQDPDFESKVRDGFARQTFMDTIGATLEDVGAGFCEIHLPFREDLCQHTGFLHAGITTTLADNACGFAAFTLMPPGSEVLSVEFKMNMLRPAIGEKLISRASVMKPGRTITVVQADVSALSDGREKPVAFMLATMMRLDGSPESTPEPAG